MDNPAPDHRCEVIDGRFIDLCDEFYKYQKNGGPESKQDSGQSGSGGYGKGGKGKFYDDDFKF